MDLISQKYRKHVNPIALSFLAVMIGYLVIAFFKLPEPYLWALEIVVLYISFINLNRYNLIVLMDRQGYILTLIFIFWLFVGFLRGVYFSNTYWEWKSVIGQLIITFFYITIFISTNIFIVQRYFSLYFISFIPLVFFSYLIDGTPLNFNYVPYSSLIIFFGIIPKKQRLILIGIVVFFFVTNFQRNDLIKILVSALIGTIFSLFSKRALKIILKPAHILLIILPIALIVLGSIGVFNVFKMDQYIKGDFEQKINTSDGFVSDDLKTDTRTFIYENVFYTMNKYDSWILGRSPAFGDEGIVGGFTGKDDKTKLKGRYGNEVGIMDILLWYGLIGVALYFLIYLRATYAAIYLSSNRYAKALGLYVSFLWTWSFIWEKPMFETFFMMDLILLGLCFSNRFRRMTDLEVKLWVKGIFIYNPKKRLA
jgi:hypothetical protein